MNRKGRGVWEGLRLNQAEVKLISTGVEGFMLNKHEAALPASNRLASVYKVHLDCRCIVRLEE